LKTPRPDSRRRSRADRSARCQWEYRIEYLVTSHHPV